MENPGTAWNKAVIMMYNFADYSVQVAKWYYINYVNDREEHQAWLKRFDGDH